MVEITRILRLHLGHASTSNPYVLFIIITAQTAQSRRLDHANSAPSSKRPQCATVIMVGSMTTLGSAGTAATVRPRSATASAGSAAAEDAAAGDVDAAGDADAGDATVVVVVGGGGGGGGAGAGEAPASCSGVSCYFLRVSYALDAVMARCMCRSSVGANKCMQGRSRTPRWRAAGSMVGLDSRTRSKRWRRGRGRSCRSHLFYKLVMDEGHLFGCTQ
jgi:hypothetical protein